MCDCFNHVVFKEPRTEPEFTAFLGCSSQQDVILLKLDRSISQEQIVGQDIRSASYLAIQSLKSKPMIGNPITIPKYRDRFQTVHDRTGQIQSVDWTKKRDNVQECLIRTFL